MTARSRRGQTEVSFQWIFVLVGGIALLLLFLGLVRGCAQSAEEETRTADLDSAATRLASAAWEGAAVQNITLPDADVTCRAGALALETETASAGLDGIPVYLPPSVGGRAQLIARDLTLAAGTPAPFPVGGVAYVIDSRTSYVLIDDAGGIGGRIIADLPDSSVFSRIQPADLMRPGALVAAVKGSPRTIVIAIAGSGVDLAAIDLAGLPSTAEIRGVALQPHSQRGGVATFYSVDPSTGRFTPDGVAPYAHERIGLGMLIAADRELSWCATETAAIRARVIVRIASDRAATLSTTAQDDACRDLLASGAEILRPISRRSGSAAFLDDLMASERDLLAVQSALLTRPGECPGLA